ncbi:hypothetical protein INR49_028989, partial [Caranx melampygus]
MKPDGVATAALEPMEALESNPENEAAPAVGQDPNQAASPVGEEMPQQPVGEMGQVEPQPEQAKETPAAKTSNKTTGDSKAKTTNKGTAKTKPTTTNTTKTTSGSRPNTSQSRLSNGVSKPQTNGVAKKSTTAPDKKSTPISPSTKKPTGTAGATASKSKVGEKKATEASPSTNGAKSKPGPTAAKKTPSTTANGVKTSTTAAAAKKPPASKPVSATPTKPSSTASPKPDKPPVSKTTRPTAGTAASSRPATGSTRPPTASTTKSSPAAAKPATPKTPSTNAKPAASKPTSTTPSGGKPPASQTSRTLTPVKKDVTKPSTAAAKKSADSPLTRPSSTTKSAKPETPKSASKDVTAKKPSTAKTAETKTPKSSKESKPTPSKATPSKTAAAKTSPKKTVGSSTPTPVKRGPKAATAAEPEKEIAAAVAAAAAIATAASAIAGAGEPEPPAEVVVEPPAVALEAESANDSVTSLGTTVMSPPCSPPGPISPVREPQDASSLLDMHVQSDPWDRNQPLASYESPSQSAVSMMHFQTEEEKENKEHFEAQGTRVEEEEEEEEEKENVIMPTSMAPPAEAFNMMAQPHSPMEDFTSRGLISPHEKEEAVEKADEEINEDNDDEEEDEDEEQRRLGHQPSSLITDMSMSQHSDEFQVRSSAFGGSAGWHGDDLLSGMDSEDVSSCTSSRQQGVSDLSSTQHTAILEGTQSSDALVDSSLRGSEGDGNLMGSPNVETLANEEEDEDEEDERVDDMDLSSERVEEHHKAFQQREQDEEDDEDVEMHSEGVTESCGNADEDDFNEEERLDNLNRSVPPPCMPPASSWGQTNPFSDTWGQPSSLLTISSPSPLSDHGAAESETPTQSPAQACLDSSAPSFAPQSEQEPQQHEAAHEEMKGSATEDAHILLTAPAVAMSQSSTLSGTDKQHTPVPASVHPDMEQDLGIHLEKGDGEEEEAETLPADEVLGTGPPTAPASAPSSPSTSGDEASDTEGEMQINDPDAPMMMDESAGFESPTPTCNLPALEEDEEAGDTHAGEGEEDGGATPQSANSVASYGFDCTTSNSNAHSMAESCGKSPGIFSLENEEQLPEEAKDPSLIKELTLPSAAAAAQAENLLGRPVDLMPLGLPGDIQPSLDEHHYMLGGMVAADHLGKVDPLEPSHHLGAEESGDTGDSQPPYYSTICDKTDSFLAGDEKRDQVDGDRKLRTHSQEDNQNQNHTTTVGIANGHYLALEDEARGEQNRNRQMVGKKVPSSHSATQDFHRQLRPVPPQDLEWNKKVDMVQQLINQSLMLSGDGGCPPLLLLPVGTGGTLSPLESSMWPNMLPQFSPPAATVTSVSSYSPDSQGSSPPGDWTVVE